MTALALEGLIASEEALVAALDANDIGLLERATTGMRDALTAVAVAAGWRESRELAPRVMQALRLAETAAGHLNYLADNNRTRLDRIAEIAGQPRSGAYGRRGRFG